MASRACPTCGLLHVDGSFARACYYDAALLPAVEGLELTENEDRILRWLAQSDKPTVDAIVSIIRKARGAGQAATAVESTACARCGCATTGHFTCGSCGTTECITAACDCSYYEAAR